MSVQNPAHTVTRWSVVGMEGMWAKMWDPPTESPAPTDQLLMVPQTVPDGKGGNSQIRPNPVPEVMFAAGLQRRPKTLHTVERELLLSLSQPTWEPTPLKNLVFFLIGDSDNDAAKAGTYPGPTLRMPRGVIFNSTVQGKGPPPHTIHWHGMEPTPLNDGVGHCSMEIGGYTYQWQPNFMGFYFLHCHRNTMQHFEYGLYSALIFEAPDAYFGSIASTNADGTVVLRTETNTDGTPKYPIGGGRDGKRRVACNLDNPLTGLLRFPQFPGFNRNAVDTPDPGPNPGDTQISFPTDPHASTVPFDVEALMVFDDRDSVWSDLAPNARATFPLTGTIPGVNDQFQLNAGVGGFFAFNDFNADYWFVTGVPVPAHKGGRGDIPPNLVIPPTLNSGISGTQISVNAQTGQVILLRILDAAYNFLTVTLPVDAVIIAWDGRALGVAPYGHNESYMVPAGTRIEMAVGRRFDALCTVDTPIDSFIIAEFINHKSQDPADEGEEIVMTARVPFVVGGDIIPPAVFQFIGQVKDQLGDAVAGVTVTALPKSLTATQVPPVVTGADGRYTMNGVTSGSYEITAAKSSGEIHLYSPTNQIVSCNAQNTPVPDIVISIACFSPGCYQINEALDSLRGVVGLKDASAFEKLRYDVAPFLNAVPAPEGVIDIRDCLNILKMVVGLPPT